MTYGHFRDGFPRIELELPLIDGGFREVQFILDSGFESDLSMSPRLLSGLEVDYVGEFPIALADLTYRTRLVYRLLLMWQGELRVTEVIAMEGNSLLGIGILLGNQVQMDVTEGGDVLVDPL